MAVPTARFQQHATRAAFFIPGFVIASWAPLVPFAKSRAALDEGMLGILLLCLGLGSIVAMPLSGLLAARHGCRAVMLVTSVLMLLALPMLTIASTPLALGIVLLVFGAAIGAMDCVMNLQAVVVERDAGRSMMSGFHAFYSIGSLVGAICVTLLLTAGLGTFAATLVAVGIALVIVALAARAWRNDRASQDGRDFAWPRGVVIAIGIVCFVSFLVEGSMLDWSAVFLHQVRGVALQHAGWGFVAFNLAMTFARLSGDRVIEKTGRATAVLAGGLIAGAGLLLATLIPVFGVSLLGYALVGIGCANIVPVMFTLAGRQTAMPESLAIPAVTTMGYAGVLAGPALIGFVAQGASLPVAFVLVAVALVAVAILGRRLTR